MLQRKRKEKEKEKQIEEAYDDIEERRIEIPEETKQAAVG